MNKHHQTFFTT